MDITREVLLRGVRKQFSFFQKKQRVGNKKRTDRDQALIFDSSGKAEGRTGCVGMQGRRNKNKKNHAKKETGDSTAKSSTAPVMSSTASAATLKCDKCQCVRHGPDRCLDQVCGGCGGNGHSAGVCASLRQSAGIAYEIQDASEEEETEAFVTQVLPGKFNDHLGGGRTDERSVRVG